MNRHSLAAGGLAAGLALLLTGCSAGSNTDGPFGKRTGQFTECVSVPRGAVATVGAEDFSNRGTPARIKKVTLVDPRDLELVAAWAVPITGTDLLGVFPGYPPLGLKGDGLPALEPGVQWKQRQQADGAKIPHTSGHNDINLVLVVKATAATGMSKDLYVDYKSGGTDYRLDLHFAIKVFNGQPDTCK